MYFVFRTNKDDEDEDIDNDSDGVIRQHCPQRRP